MIEALLPVFVIGDLKAIFASCESLTFRYVPIVPMPSDMDTNIVFVSPDCVMFCEFKSKLPPSCGVVSCTTSVIPPLLTVSNSNAVPPAFTLTNFPACPVKFAGVSVKPAKVVVNVGVFVKLL